MSTQTPATPTGESMAEFEVMPGVRIAGHHQVRITRVLVFEGSVEWVALTLAKRWLKTNTNVFADTVFGDTQNVAREEALRIEVL